MKLDRVPWLATTLAVAATATLIALVAFGLPDSLMTALARVTRISALLPSPSLPVVRVQSSRWAQDANVLPDSVRAPLPEGGAFTRLRALRERPPLLIETATLVIPPGSGGLRIAAPSITLRDVTIVTNGAPLAIETEALDVTNSAIRSFAAGDAEAAGKDGGTVRVVLHTAMRGQLIVDLPGQNGAPGAPGTPGQTGAGGAPGQRARSGPTECLAPAGRGGEGRTGGPGGLGGNGRSGGNGGTLDLTARSPLAITSQVQFTAAGGIGGPGGRGGPGGPGGDPAGVCFGSGPAGNPGQDGLPGAAGTAGQDGAEGQLHVHDLTGT